MGSLSAMAAGSADRYFQDDSTELSKLVPEVIEGMVPFKGSVQQMVDQLVGGLSSGMGLAGCATIEAFRRDVRFLQITSTARSAAGVDQRHAPHVAVRDLVSA